MRSRGQSCRRSQFIRNSIRELPRLAWDPSDLVKARKTGEMEQVANRIDWRLHYATNLCGIKNSALISQVENHLSIQTFRYFFTELPSLELVDYCDVEEGEVEDKKWNVKPRQKELAMEQLIDATPLEKGKLNV
ncbi:uncharacterized protein A4U43_C02F10580 [Asparagus officinalis]|uniref:Uncharacterized protein n=1 Tax=Asparagus officinalis TaxID=4686 RepID=A0A5P1FI82_ASPOF|nr:uncharacterized protein A4U43_C02F10580 [Asparagus officinalis]